MNIGQMMKQVQEMQAKMMDMQSRLGEIMITGQSGGGMVVVTMNGKTEMKKISIDPKIIDADEKEMLEDLIVAAVNDAKAKAEKQIAEETEKMMGGLKLPPGVKLPL
ncbi:MAG: YbaB/EbfC family nucleoid-associated protein [Alphaproteobacteria bacterium]|nr:YbaB/EbfC family nucleoid-associated protein [Alphaproteobacteria bacterium]